MNFKRGAYGNRKILQKLRVFPPLLYLESTKRERVLGRIRGVLLETAKNMRHIADILENDKQLYGRTSLLPDQESTEILTAQVSESALGEKDAAEKSSAE